MTFDKPQNIICNNSHFEGGQATGGSGGGVAVLGLTSHDSQCTNDDISILTTHNLWGIMPKLVEAHYHCLGV